ncbi:AAA family ATPase [Streptomyces griseorubiginosus]|uniref:AAA family ATPase n=1 Tax=Streptomyces griseorubiginosus TaxID=67304 RepID=UPI0034511BC9
MVVAVDDYATADEEFTAGIRAQVETVTGWLAHPSLGPDRRFEVTQSKELTCAEDLRAFLADQKLARVAWDEALVVYVTGHGLRGMSRRHYLTFAGTDDERLLATAFPTSELVTQVLDSEAEHVLVLVDSCFAGSLKSELGVLFEELSAQRRKLKTLAVITSGDFEQRPRLGEFTRLLELALAKARDESAGFTAPHLSLEEWEKLLGSVGEDNPELIQALWVWPDSRRHEPTLCLPNPHFQPREQVVQAPRESVSLSASVLEQYWLSRASGRTDDEDPGWYFSGRQDLMRALVEFVRAGDGVLVVTGAAGSGKSALLARVVTLSDPLFVTVPRFAKVVQAIPAPLRPVVGGVDAAVLARGKSSLALIEDLLTAFGGTHSRGEPALQALLQRIVTACEAKQGPVTVVVDGLDEAQEPAACLSDVIGPVARLRTRGGQVAARLVVGMRSSARDVTDGRLQDTAADQLLDVLHTVLQAAVGEAYVPLTRLHTDGPQTRQDIAAYVRAVLQAQDDSPYAGREEEAVEAAAVIAAAVAPSFLDARLAAAQLRSARDVQDLHDPGWRSRLLAGTTALLSSDLREVAEEQRVDLPVLLAVLRATAFGQGSGLPWAEVWPATVTALLGADAPAQDVVDTAIRTVRHSRLVGYLTASEEDARVTYRPVHQRVSEVLLREPGLLVVDPLTGQPETWAAALQESRPPELVHRAIAQALAALARQSGHLAPHPYVRRHTVAHAQQGGVLDDSVMPVELAARESSGTLRGRLGLPLPFGEEQRRVVTSAGLIEPYLDESVDVSSRLSSIRFHLTAQAQSAASARVPGVTVLAALSSDTALPTHWAHWRPRGNVVASPAGRVHAMCSLRTLDGRDLLAASTPHGLGVWDSASGQQLVSIDTGVAHGLTVARGTSGRPFLVVAQPTSASVFDPLSGRQLARIDRFSVRMISVARDGEARWLMVVASGRSLLLWRPSEGETQWVALPDDLRLPERLAWVRDPDGRGYHVCKRVRKGWVLFDPLTRDVLPLQLPYTAARPLAAVRGPSGGDLLAFLPKPGASVHVIDPFQPSTSVDRLPSRGRRVVALPAPEGGDALGVVSDDAVEMWDLSTSAPHHAGRYPARPQSLFARVGSSGSRKLAITGDEGILLHRNTARRRSSFPGERVLAPPLSPRVARGMAALEPVGGRQYLAVASGATVVVLDPRTGQGIGGFKHSSPVTFVGPMPGSHDGPAVVVGDATSVHLWRLGHETATAMADDLHDGSRCLVQLPDGKPGLAVVGRAGIGVVDLHAGSGFVSLPPGHTPLPSTLVALPSPDGHSLVAGTVRARLLVWDLVNGELLEQIPLPQRHAITALCVVPLPEGRFTLATATSREITFWDPHRWKIMHRLATPSTTVLHALPQPSGSWLLAAGSGTGLRLWEPLTGSLVHTLLTAAPVASIAYTSAHKQQFVHVGGPAGIATLDWPPKTA